MCDLKLNYPNLFEGVLREALQRLGYQLRTRGNTMHARRGQLHICFYWLRNPLNPRTLIHSYIAPIGLACEEAGIRHSPKLWEAVNEVLGMYRKLAGSGV